jgi:hypothetical protein
MANQAFLEGYQLLIAADGQQAYDQFTASYDHIFLAIID